ncbi:MAG TPA: hypothetical protein VMM12_11745 [Longimicrobiales bacterium]|nr:hypothetical protein [Longimicrobiales bacterium]
MPHVTHRFAHLPRDRATITVVVWAALTALPGAWTAPLVAQAADTAGTGAAHDSPDRPALRIRPILAGTAFGAATAVMAVNPSGPSAVGDEALVALGALTGILFGVLVQSSGAEMAFSAGWGAVRVGDLRDRLAESGERRQAMGPQAWETRLSLLRPVSPRWAVGPAFVVETHTFEQIERETRCGWFFGCITGDFVTSYSNLQALSAGAVSRLALDGRGRFFATAGGGLAAIRLDSSMGPGDGVSPYLEAGAGVSASSGLVRALEVGTRLLAADTGPSRVDLSGVFLRLNLVYGPFR